MTVGNFDPTESQKSTESKWTLIKQLENNSGKWIEIKEPVSKIIKIINRKDGTKFIRQLKFIGEYNNIPLFIQSIKHEKQNSTFELICIESYLPILNKKIK